MILQIGKEKTPVLRIFLVLSSSVILALLNLNVYAASKCIIPNHIHWTHLNTRAGVCGSYTETSPGVLKCVQTVDTPDWYQSTTLIFWQWNGTNWVQFTNYAVLNVSSSAKEQIDAIIQKYPSLIPEADQPCQDYRYAFGCNYTPTIDHNSRYKCIVVNKIGWNHRTDNGGGICNSIIEKSPGSLGCGDCGIDSTDWYQLSSSLTFWGWDGTKWSAISGYYPLDVTKRAKDEVEEILSQYPTLSSTANDPSHDPSFISGCEMAIKKYNTGTTCPTN